MNAAEAFPHKSWLQLHPDELIGDVLILGASDSGKSVLARWLVQKIAYEQGSVGWIDGDIGQSVLGLPSTMNLALVREDFTDPPKPEATYFVGANTPIGRLLPVVAGLKRLQEESEVLGIKNLVIDTTGFVDKTHGGLALKEWKIEILQPETVISLQSERELEPVIAPLRKHPSIQLVELPIASAVKSKSIQQRTHKRRERFRQYFRNARPITISISDLPVYDLPLVRKLSLVGLLDERSFCIALGIVKQQRQRELEISTPLLDSAHVAAIRVGSMRVDPVTGLEI